jgi:hypothetical protein
MDHAPVDVAGRVAAVSFGTGAGSLPSGAELEEQIALRAADVGPPAPALLVQ